MNESSMQGRHRDEWSELILLVMKTSLSVAHELGLPPDSTLDCAARHLLFRDFTWFASAMQGASRVLACCGSGGDIPAVEIAYIKTLAERVESNRNVLAYIRTIYATDLHAYGERPAHAYERVAAAIQALKADVRREFSQSAMSSNAAVECASGFAKALAAIMHADGNADAYERALAAVMHVRFAESRHLVHGDTDDARRHLTVDGRVAHMQTSFMPDDWKQRVKDAVNHPNSLHK
ncbi:hypothetical protein RI103_33215 [Paraburkholderia sp. FT54]|uniref:hypothetical protein n=1 Tax=Paraburkholderia sp. FT54 TaxID=3074437 RepID=UPI00287779C8|nr:hypothetical protein [Paraburkholderia sp. FT54]WNC94803.1 hypothetical protein RI103_33215 [Paraburkholderia sp. FT54]